MVQNSGDFIEFSNQKMWFEGGLSIKHGDLMAI